MKKLLIMGIMAFAVLFPAGCGHVSDREVTSKKSDAVQVGTLREKARLEVRDFVRSNLIMCMGLYKGEVFYLQEFEDSFRLFFFNPEKKQTRTVAFPRGKGPGELQQAMGVKIADKKIIIPDFFMKRLNIFNLDGSFADSFQMDPKSELDVIQNFTIEGDILYFCGMTSTLVGQYNVREMVLENRVPNGIKDTPKDSEPYLGVSLVKEKGGFLYAGHINAPYRITIFNEELQPVKEIRVDSEKEYTSVRWAIGPGFTSNAGDHLISTLALHRGVLAAPECSLRIRRKGNRFSLENFDGSIYFFDSASGKLALVLAHPIFNNVSILSMVGMDDDSLAFYIYRQPQEDDAGTNTIFICRIPPEVKELFKGQHL
ncbi:MAG TPA: hypothetical protein ENL46_07565 [Candidatus Aminicenantes bacterium]|nr:hypothetical protein [Candidatus Aminicenantes bacterium]